MTIKWLINGVASDSISVMDRGLNYADGLFETIAVRGRSPRFLDYHLDRLTSSCRRLGIPLPSGVTVADEVCELAADCETGTVKILMTRGTGERGYAPPRQSVPNRIVGLLPDAGFSPEHQKNGIAVKLCDNVISINPGLAGMKTLGRLEQVLARAELSDTDFTEGLMSTVEGQVVCGTMSNLFAVTAGVLLTPDLSRCGVNGVMRRLVMEQAAALGIDCREADIDPEDLFAADELFLTNSLIGIWPVVRLESTEYEIGPVTRRSMGALAGAGVAECGA